MGCVRSGARLGARSQIRQILAAAALLMGALLLYAPPSGGAAAGEDAARLVLSRASGEVGAKVRVRGEGFPARARGRIAWDGAAARPRAVKTDGRGAFAATARVPAVEPGARAIRGSVSGSRASASFTVLGPAIAPSPTPATPIPPTATATPTQVPPTATPVPPSGEETCLGVPAYPEVRPENAAANRTPGAPIDDAYAPRDLRWKAYWDRINGQGCLGTTGQILGWAAKKWRFDQLGYPDLAKAMAWQESTWIQSGVGDHGLSFGILQVKKTVYPGTYPLSQQSTPFNADFAMAFVRAAYDGQLSWIPQTRGDIRAAVGAWFDGGNPTGPGGVDYANKVFGRYSARPWGQGG